MGLSGGTLDGIDSFPNALRPAGRGQDRGACMAVRIQAHEAPTEFESRRFATDAGVSRAGDASSYAGLSNQCADGLSRRRPAPCSNSR